MTSEAVRSNYRLTTYKDGAKKTSFPFIVPEPGIYQIITDLGFSMTIDPTQTPVSCLDDDTIYLVNGNICVDKYIVSHGIRVDETCFNITGSGNSDSSPGTTTISFSVIDHEGKNYIYCPSLRFHN